LKRTVIVLSTLTLFILLAAFAPRVFASSRSGLAAQKTVCHYVVKKVHGKKTKVKVCKKVTPTPTPTPSPTPGIFSLPTGLALDPQGDLYVADGGRGVIDKLSPSGSLLQTIGSLGSGAGQFRVANFIALDAQGNLYVADSANHRIQKLSPDGKPLAQFADPAFQEPFGVAVDSLGNVYTASPSDERAGKFAADGKLVAGWGAGVQIRHSSAVALDAAGNLYVSRPQDGKIQVLSPDGKALTLLGPAGGPTRPSGLAFDNQGNLYVVDRSGSKVFKLSPQGDVLASWGDTNEFSLAAAAVARRFARRASDVASAHAGRIIEIRGDAALGVFNSPRQALRAAIAIHSPQTSTADDSLPLPIGVGIDSGEAVPVDGGYRGAALNLAARLCSLAGPGEILASDTVARLARRLDNVRYQERGATLPVGAVVLDRPPSSPGTITMPWR
jgi:sugar lactone lactonase YvrE